MHKSNLVCFVMIWLKYDITVIDNVAFYDRCIFERYKTQKQLCMKHAEQKHLTLETDVIA